MDVYFQPGSDDKKQYKNPNCYLSQAGIKPYRRCNYCELNTHNCLGLQNNVISALIILLLVAFIFIDNSSLIRANIIAIGFLLLLLGYRINSNLDNLARSNHINEKLNEQLQHHSSNLEAAVKERTLKLKEAAIRDSLTGLTNRSEFERILQDTLDDAFENGSEHVLCFLDLDRFKVINDSCGHKAGDELLRQISPILSEHIRDADELSRFGGDEFIILFSDCTLEKSMEISERIRKSIENYRFSWEGSTFSIGASIGIVEINNTSGSMIDVLTTVDEACYIAKEQGRNQVHAFEYKPDEIERRRGELQWVARITSALDADSFLLHYQPIVPASSTEDKIKHYEALIRKQDPSGELLPPMAFLPAAERFNLISKIDRWVIKKAFEDCKQFQAYQPTCLSVNLSGASLTDDTLYDYIKSCFSSVGLSPQTIVFEITETAAIANLHKASNLIEKLRILGCKISLDDFGSGLSSFGYLKHLPIDYVKIDGGFVKNMDKDKSDKSMVEVINYIGHTLNKKTIAEHVSSPLLATMIKDIGVDYMQGYEFGKPCSFEETVYEVNSQRA